MTRESFTQKLENIESSHADLLSVAMQFLHIPAAPGSVVSGYLFMGRHVGRWSGYFDGVRQRKQD